MKTQSFLWGVSILVWCSYASFTCKAEEPSQLSALEQINTDVTNKEQELQQLVLLARQRHSELENLQRSIGQLRKKQEETEAKKAQSQKSLNTARTTAATHARELAEIESISRLRLRAFYMAGGLHEVGAVQQLISSGLHNGLARNAVYLEHIREFDAKTRAQLLNYREEQIKLAQALEQAVTEVNGLAEKYEAQAKLLRDQLVAKEALVNSIEKQRQNIQLLLTNLRAQALRLETVVVSLTEGQALEPQPISRLKEPKKVESKEENSKNKEENVLPKADFAPGKLHLPVQGHFAKSSEIITKNNFSDLVHKKGIQIETTPGAMVSAVQSGTVAFSGNMPGYGLVVIIAHGGRFFSLYGMLGESKVSSGETIQIGQALGTVQDQVHSKGGQSQGPEAKGPVGQNNDPNKAFLYLELRQGANPLNPRKYFNNL